MGDSLRDLLLRTPKAELHLHLRGAIPIDTMAHLLERHPVEEALRSAPLRHKWLFGRFDNIRPFLGSAARPPVADLFHYGSFRQFVVTYLFTGYFVRDREDVKALVDGVLAQLRSQNVAYAEITITLFDYVHRGIPIDDVIECMERASACSSPRVQWIVDLVRDIGPKAAFADLRALVDSRIPGIVGITLGGSEDRHPPAKFARVYETAREHGLRLTVHAGEAAGPESVWDALKILGAERIGHGVRAIEDPSLVEYLAEHQVPLEVCPTSNLCTGIYPSYDAHPLKRLHDAGVPMTINSDDPTFFHTTLVDEYVHAAEMGFAEGELLDLVRNGFRHAFLPEDEVERN
jgi:adenosine deaminase